MQAIDLQEKAVDLLVSTILRAMTFWLAITAVLTGYVLAQGDKVSKDIRLIIMNLEIFLSCCTFVLFCAGAWALFGAVSNLNSALLSIDEEAYKKSRFSYAYRNTRTMIWIATIITMVGAIVFIAGLVYLRAEIAA